VLRRLCLTPPPPYRVDATVVDPTERGGEEEGEEESVSEEPGSFCLAASTHLVFFSGCIACVFCIIAEGLLPTNTHLSDR
jgi:hypothetical protein